MCVSGERVGRYCSSAPQPYTSTPPREATPSHLLVSQLLPNLEHDIDAHAHAHPVIIQHQRNLQTYHATHILLHRTHPALGRAWLTSSSSCSSNQATTAFSTPVAQAWVWMSSVLPGPLRTEQAGSAAGPGRLMATWAEGEAAAWKSTSQLQECSRDMGCPKVSMWPGCVQDQGQRMARVHSCEED